MIRLIQDALNKSSRFISLVHISTTFLVCVCCRFFSHHRLLAPLQPKQTGAVHLAAARVRIALKKNPQTNHIRVVSSRTGTVSSAGERRTLVGFSHLPRRLSRSDQIKQGECDNALKPSDSQTPT